MITALKSRLSLVLTLSSLIWSLFVLLDFQHFDRTFADQISYIATHAADHFGLSLYFFLRFLVTSLKLIDFLRECDEEFAGWSEAGDER